MTDSADSTPVIRVSDADRERTHSYLSAAMTLGVLSPEEYTERAGQAVVARTRADLDALTADLPLDQLRSEVVAETGQTQISTSGAKPMTKVSGFIGTSDIGGGAVVGDELRVNATLGSVALDLRDVEFTAPVLTVQCRAFMGSIEVTVPPDVTLEVHGSGIVGSVDSSASGAGGDGAPRVVMQGRALLGSITVDRRPRGEPVGPRRPR